jgi:hypothetical protein
MTTKDTLMQLIFDYQSSKDRKKISHTIPNKGLKKKKIEKIGIRKKPFRTTRVAAPCRPDHASMGQKTSGPAWRVSICLGALG